ncbi:lactonase family protein [Pseudonocardia kujensis]|uniref:lactonase family protein n=1 Tax=Pseudonocardia kujensis TaxID=1128675 RepID=UPI001E4DBC12|nr:beta-propeller fold lactonase family protein [Pseudonocardia kujensis]MCE0765975.1 lactonase family protein [Pseudonocardia kujensis]
MTDVLVGCFTADLWCYFTRPDTDTTISSRGIERLVLDDDTGALRPDGVAADGVSSPQYLALHPGLPVLYAAEFARPGRIAVLDVGPGGRLTRRASVDSLGGMAVAVTVDPAGDVAYVAHLDDGALTACLLDERGGIRVVRPVVPGMAQPMTGERFAYRGSGSKLHQVRVTPDGGGLVVADVGTDSVVTYPAGAGPNPAPLSCVGFPEASFPRHVEFHPSGRTAYVVGEGDATLYELEARQHVPVRIVAAHRLVPDGTTALPSELHLHPDGRTLFVGLRRADAVAVLDVDGEGAVRLRGHEPSRGRNPRAVRVSPSGRHLLVGNWDSNTVVVFEIGEDGWPRPLGEPVEVPSPSSFAFAS